ncbi:MAG: endolytic transglycosylase MltG [Rhodospirillaceae bacterium]|jgi:UPF0755 protein|nr:endolytic transglycosylase MltG [Rhodospirillaceae bacterium]MBT4588959.1 endolytic transglycosylase MltG [Rhodospirillaceae bacterium]MBT4939459.1 endolytic transglycosylase MltG [Rhodospirillaceae bacterium]MBT5938362.1 endolytic transglycosylase MltG [Rhodospirillaceae bacterium]MBT7267243.1 endolytic transglycosylase MltG [Rhodospirillaceae bacterium]
MGRLLRWLGIFLFIIFVGVAGVGFWGYAEFVQPGPLPADKVVVIPRGVGIERIAITLARHNIIKVPIVLSMAARTIAADKSLQAGEFAFPKNVSPRGVLEILQSGKQVVRRLTIAEGLTKSEILKIIKNTEGLAGSVLVPVKEGELLPETYYFTFGDSRNALAKRMQDGMNKALVSLWASRPPNLPIKNIEEMLVLASIIEKETGRAAERARVAGVFVNRLRLNMRLQSDPTVSYGITRGERELGRALTRTDLKTPNPYNTYVIKGLPPGPIANPGRAALEAVLHPADTGELYFVADGSGGHAFARNLAEHNRNVAKWRKLQKSKN